MKTYAQTLTKLAYYALGSYLGGSYAPMQNCDTVLVAFIYSMDVKDVDQDLQTEFKRVQDAYYSQLVKG